MLFISCACQAFTPVHCSLMVTCLERTDLLALVCEISICFVTFPCGILGQVWYLIVSIYDLCHLSYFTVLSDFFFINLKLFSGIFHLSAISSSMKYSLLTVVLTVCLMFAINNNMQVEAIFTQIRRLVACCAKKKCNERQFCVPLSGSRCICEYPYDERWGRFYLE